MPNRNYISGRNFEYRVKRHLEKLGYYVVRSFASKGVFDLVAVPPVECPVLSARNKCCLPLLIQCKKRDYISPKEMKTLIDAASRYHAISMIATRDSAKHLLFKEIIPTAI